MLVKKNTFKNTFLLTILATIIVGLILFWVTEYIPNILFKSVVSNVASALFISGVFGAVNEYMLKNSLVDLILDKLKLKEDIDRTGIEEVFFGISDIDYKYYIKRAKKNIDIVHVYGRTWTNTNIDVITETLMNSSCKIRVILVSPESPFVPALSEHYGTDVNPVSVDDLKKTMTDVAGIWKELSNKYNAHRSRRAKGSLKLYYHNGPPTNSIYRIDDRVILVTGKTTKSKSTILPSFICKDTNKNEDLYNIYIDEIENLITESTEYSF